MKVLLFGITREIAGVGELVLKAPFPAKVKELKEQLFNDFPSLKAVSSLAVAVNSEIAEESLAISPADEIALIPPVSGG